VGCCRFGGHRSKHFELARVSGHYDVEAGVSLPGLYPPNEQSATKYDVWKREQKN
jgi:hypothetical protein